MKTPDEIKAEQLQNTITGAEERLRKAQEALAATTGGTTTPANKKSVFSIKNILSVGLAGTVGVGSGMLVNKGIDALGRHKEESSQKGKKVQRVATKKEGQPGFMAPNNVPMTNLAEQAQANKKGEKKETPEPSSTIKKHPTPEELMKEINAKYDQRDEALIKIKPKMPVAQKPAPETPKVTPKPETSSNTMIHTVEEMAARIAQLEAKSAAPATVESKPVEKTHEEKIQEIREKIAKGIPRTRQESAMFNKHISDERARMAAERVRKVKETKEKEARAKVMAEIRRAETENTESLSTEGVRVTGKNTEVGVNFNYRVGPWNDNFNGPVPTPTKEKIGSNPLKLSPEMLEKSEEIYKSNLKKMFPKAGAAKAWEKIKNKNAHDFMAEKPKKEYVSLHNHLKTLKGQPDINMSIDEFLRQEYQKAGRDGKFDQVTLK